MLVPLELLVQVCTEFENKKCLGWNAYIWNTHLIQHCVYMYSYRATHVKLYYKPAQLIIATVDFC